MFYRMMMILWICLITLIITSQHVHSKVIIINTTGGSDNTICCVDGECDCSSLSTALNKINGSTTVNITSKSLLLDHDIFVETNREDITIIGNGVTIMCNYSWSVYFMSCCNVVLEGIIWDRCGRLNGENDAAFIVYNTNNTLLINCTFQNARIPAVLIREVANVTVIHCSFKENMLKKPNWIGTSIGGLTVEKSGSHLLQYIIIHGSSFYHNGYFGTRACYFEYTTFGLNLVDDGSVAGVWKIFISKTVFAYNNQSLTMALSGQKKIIKLHEVYFYNNTLSCSQKIYSGMFSLITKLSEARNVSNMMFSMHSSTFSGNTGRLLNLQCTSENNATIVFTNSNFTNNKNNFGDSIVSINALAPSKPDVCFYAFRKVVFANNTVSRNKRMDYEESREVSGILSFHSKCFSSKLNMTQVHFISNRNSIARGGAMYLQYSTGDIAINECIFTNNTSVRGAAIYVDSYSIESDPFAPYNNEFYIQSSNFQSNVAEDSIIYTDQSSPLLGFIYLNFTNNIGTCIFLSQSQAFLTGSMLFINNTAENGAALYLDHGSSIKMYGSIQFVNNSAALYGGAIFADLAVGCDKYDVIFPYDDQDKIVSFINNAAGYGGSCIYISVSKYCNIVANSSDLDSIMHMPYEFNYSQIINGTLTHIPTDYNYTWLNVTQFPVVTSPHRLILHGDNIKSIGNNSMLSNNDAYFIDNKILGKPVTFEGLVLDYFEKPSAVSEYHVQCIDCSTNWAVTNTPIEIDNTSPVSVTVTGEKIVNSLNVTLHLTSYQSFYQNPIQTGQHYH